MHPQLPADASGWAAVIRLGGELQPHRLKRYMASPAPDFEAKAKDILGPYLRRCAPRHTSEAFVDFLDEALA